MNVKWTFWEPKKHKKYTQINASGHFVSISWNASNGDLKWGGCELLFALASKFGSRQNLYSIGPLGGEKMGEKRGKFAPIENGKKWLKNTTKMENWPYFPFFGGIFSSCFFPFRIGANFPRFSHIFSPNFCRSARFPLCSRPARLQGSNCREAIWTSAYPWNYPLRKAFCEGSLRRLSFVRTYWEGTSLRLFLPRGYCGVIFAARQRFTSIGPLGLQGKNSLETLK